MSLRYMHARTDRSRLFNAPKYVINLLLQHLLLLARLHILTPARIRN